MRKRLGDTFDKFSLSHQKEAPVSIRLNPRKPILDRNEQVAWCENGRYLSKRPMFAFDPLWHAGTYYVQEASSMFLEQAIKQIDRTPVRRVLDLCAAPGGKSTHLLSLLGQNTLVVSNEVIRSRASILAENVIKWGYPNNIITSNDPVDFSRLEGFFDMIVVDAPCSGEGLFRKNPSSMTEWSSANISLCTARQKRILSDAWPSLAQGGHLVYCTCTYNPDENEHVLHEFGKSNDVEFQKIDIDSSWGIEEVQHHSVTGYRFYPHQVKGEGFFLSLLRKKDGKEKAKHRHTYRFSPTPGKHTGELKSWLKSGDQFRLFELGKAACAIPEIVAEDAGTILNKLSVLHAGTPIAAIKHSKLIPEPALALSIDLNHDPFNSLDLQPGEALKYLRKEAPVLTTQLKGFALIKYNGMGLGWVNLLQNRINNLYPSHWRIRKEILAD